MPGAFSFEPQRIAWAADVKGTAAEAAEMGAAAHPLAGRWRGAPPCKCGGWSSESGGIPLSDRSKKLIKYVIPTMLGSISFFLFTIVDGIFVGRGVGTNALGAVNLVMPFVMVVNALFQLTTIGGVAIIAVRLGRGDVQGANHAFMR